MQKHSPLRWREGMGKKTGEKYSSKKEGEKRERGRRQEIMTQPEITGTQ